ncbi:MULTISPECIES: hypothetical protein [unclassified Streptomyces]|uniref:hypothetical protein n=1 Tax=unclassified Streptomyces TaxID=2593676 RepID=UPI00365952ED
MGMLPFLRWAAQQFAIFGLSFCPGAWGGMAVPTADEEPDRAPAGTGPEEGAAPRMCDGPPAGHPDTLEARPASPGERELWAGLGYDV